MDDLIEEMLNERRSLEKTLVDLLAEYERNPRPSFARTIDLIRTEIALKEQS